MCVRERERERERAFFRTMSPESILFFIERKALGDLPGSAEDFRFCSWYQGEERGSELELLGPGKLDVRDE